MCVCVILYPLWPPPPASQQALFRATGGQHRPVRKANVRNLNKKQIETALPSSTKPIYIWLERICHYNSRSPTKSIVWIQDPLATVMSLLKGTRSILRSQTCKHVAACQYSECVAMFCLCLQLFWENPPKKPACKECKYITQALLKLLARSCRCRSGGTRHSSMSVWVEIARWMRLRIQRNETATPSTLKSWSC